MRTIDADGLKKQIMSPETWSTMGVKRHMCNIIDNAPTVEGKLSDKQIEEITDLLEIQWGYEGIREDVSRILRGEEE